MNSSDPGLPQGCLSKSNQQSTAGAVCSECPVSPKYGPCLGTELGRTGPVWGPWGSLKGATWYVLGPVKWEMESVPAADPIMRHNLLLARLLLFCTQAVANMVKPEAAERTNDSQLRRLSSVLQTNIETKQSMRKTRSNRIRFEGGECRKGPSHFWSCAAVGLRVLELWMVKDEW